MSTRENIRLIARAPLPFIPPVFSVLKMSAFYVGYIYSSTFETKILS